MPEAIIRITSRPIGDAPEEIRDKWIGLMLPVYEDYNGPVSHVLSHQKVADSFSGYRVIYRDAMAALEKKHPDARAWWDMNVGDRGTLIFDKDCCEVVPD